jgi:RNA polymerase sigma-54 factor
MSQRIIDGIVLPDRCDGRRRREAWVDSLTLGKIVFARCLDQPLRTYRSAIESIEESERFRKLAWVERGLLAGARVEPPVSGACSLPLSLGRIVVEDGHPVFLYRASVFAREYRFDEARLREQQAGGALADRDIALLHRLRLVNSRNRLTHALMTALLDMQREFLVTGDPLALAPLTQAAMSRFLTARAHLPMAADTGRISRLARGLGITLPDGRTQPLAGLFPGERRLHCQRVDALVKSERQLLLAGKIERPWSDGRLAALLERQYGTRLSRRSITAIRHRLAIPDSRCRAARADYRSATEGFSPLLPMTRSTLSAHVPPQPGVYEIRAPGGPPADTEGRCDGEPIGADRIPVVYIGSTRDLRKRLSDHLRGSSGNIRLASYLTGGRAKVRFRPIQRQWRQIEKHLYRTFCDTYGTPPACNRMSP